MLTKFIDNVISKASPSKAIQQLRAAPRGYFDWRKGKVFQTIMKYVYKNSPFYKRKFDEFGINPNKVKILKDLGSFYTVPEDIINNAEEFLCQRPHMVFEGYSGEVFKLFNG